MDRLRRGLVVGINTYEHSRQLTGCVADAEAISKVLRWHSDDELNFECNVLLDKTEENQPITSTVLEKACRELFADIRDDVVLYFSGHGVLTEHGGYLCANDSTRDHWGVSMDTIMRMASSSKARDILIILDCCHAGDIASPGLLAGNGQNPLALLREDATVIAASLSSQASVEADGRGVFTRAVVDALEGGAADMMGWVTASSIYAYVERRFGAFEQRPVYKSYATGVRVVRKCPPKIERPKLRRLVEFFNTQEFQYQLDPEHEREDRNGKLKKSINEEKVAIGRLLKNYRDAGLLKPTIPGEQLFWTAQDNHTVELTWAGREYWWLAKQKRL
jgi:hypothetical protein